MGLNLGSLTKNSHYTLVELTSYYFYQSDKLKFDDFWNYRKVNVKVYIEEVQNTSWNTIVSRIILCVQPFLVL